MSRATLSVNAGGVVPGGTFTVPYNGQVQADFVVGQTVNLQVYGADVACAVTFGASAATVTWPAGKSYNLPSDTYYIDFDLVGGDEQDRFNQAENQADSTAIDVAGIVADHNALLAKLKAAGLMVAD